MREVILSLGTNLGDKELNILEMEREIEAVVGSITKRSPIYITAPIGVSDNHPDYLNRVISINYNKSPEELLAQLQLIENKLGREDKGKLKPRIADIDILLFQDEERNSIKLTIPHHALFDRRFSYEGALNISPHFMLLDGKVLKNIVVDNAILEQELFIYNK